MTRAAFVDHCLELLAPLGHARARRMFGGHGLYLDDLFVAIVADERLFLKGDAATRPRFEAAGCRPFTYTARGRSLTLGFWTVPDDAMDAAPAMAPWARLAIEAAVRSRAAGGRRR